MKKQRRGKALARHMKKGSQRPKPKKTGGLPGSVGGGGLGTAGPPGSAKDEAFRDSIRRTLRQFKADVRTEIEGAAGDIRLLRENLAEFNRRLGLLEDSINIAPESTTEPGEGEDAVTDVPQSNGVGAPA